jgi:hypothetical protein
MQQLARRHPVFLLNQAVMLHGVSSHGVAFGLTLLLLQRQCKTARPSARLDHKLPPLPGSHQGELGKEDNGRQKQQHIKSVNDTGRGNLTNMGDGSVKDGGGRKDWRSSSWRFHEKGS